MENSSYPIENFNKRAVIINKSAYQDKDLFVIAKEHYNYIDKIVISKGMVFDRIEKLAQDIFKEYAGKTIHFLVVMKGALFFSNKLTECLANLFNNQPQETKFFLDYITVKSYDKSKSTGEVKILIEDKVIERIKNKHVIVIEDTYDTGLSFSELFKRLKEIPTQSLKAAVLVHKMNPLNLKYKMYIDYIGFLIPDEYVIGLGFDYNDDFRYLNHVCTFFPEEMSKLHNE